jgi:DNA-binding response OmpR family regulator
VVVSSAQEIGTCLKDSLDDLGFHTHCVSGDQELEEFLQMNQVSVILWEGEDHSWRNFLDGLAGMDRPPRLIVMSRLADERLWAEVLKLGGYDVLAKPLDGVELRRVVGTAAGMTRTGSGALPVHGGKKSRVAGPAQSGRKADLSSGTPVQAGYFVQTAGKVRQAAQSVRPSLSDRTQKARIAQPRFSPSDCHLRQVNGAPGVSRVRLHQESHCEHPFKMRSLPPTVLDVGRTGSKPVRNPQLRSAARPGGNPDD